MSLENQFKKETLMDTKTSGWKQDEKLDFA